MNHHADIYRQAMAAAAGQSPSSAEAPVYYHWLLRLPPQFWSRMGSYLKYSEILALQQLSSQFREFRVEEFLPWTERIGFISNLDKSLTGVEMGSFTIFKKMPCYLCFRLRDTDQFQKLSDLATHGRVVRRDVYRGTREFVKEEAPEIPHEDRVRAQMAMGGPVQAPAVFARRNLSAEQVRQHIAMHVETYNRFEPKAPGEPVGRLESLRRYCLDCAISTKLLRTGDVVTTAGEKRESFWLCACHRLQSYASNEACRQCGHPPVYRSNVSDTKMHKT